jgi:16S rRNA (guanine966-N2)-methyltransferase
VSNPRIIAGKARGTRLEVVPGNTTRPITDRVNEALFNIIGADIIDSSFLDLFGGTGSVGIEALSRGNKFSRFIDISSIACNVIRNNLQKSHLQNQAEVICMDAFKYINGSIDRQFDYIYIAPPQYKNLWLRTIHTLDLKPMHASDDGWVIIQIDPIEILEFSLKNFQIIDKRKYGSTLLLFFEKKV